MRMAEITLKLTDVELRAVLVALEASVPTSLGGFTGRPDLRAAAVRARKQVESALAAFTAPRESR